MMKLTEEPYELYVAENGIKWRGQPERFDNRHTTDTRLRRPEYQDSTGCRG